MIHELIKEKNISIYKLSKQSGLPYTTISDICSGKTQLEKCSAETIYKLAKALKMTMEELLEPYISERDTFEVYKSNICHRVKSLGDKEFIIEILENDPIRKYYKKKWYPECFYLLAMLDYISRENDIPLCTDYDDLRQCKLKEPLYPSGVLISDNVLKDKKIKEKAYNEAIPEFKHFNIIENEVRNIV